MAKINDVQKDIIDTAKEKLKSATINNNSYKPSVSDALRRGVGTPMANYRNQKIALEGVEIAIEQLEKSLEVAKTGS
ncbi:hypothetical protein [Shewanella oncorhynchi]|uniref:hypothetical protein n=1 Tax=Shewanella oncorhynchi TaxID=2726434 RepID=UPI003D79D175